MLNINTPGIKKCEANQKHAALQTGVTKNFDIASVYVCSVCVHTCVCVHVRLCMHPYKHANFCKYNKPLGQICDIIGDR